MRVRQSSTVLGLAALAAAAAANTVAVVRTDVDMSSIAKPRALAAGDLDGDGKLDVAVASYGGDLAWYANPDWTEHSVAAPGQCHGLAAEDLDSDGDLDLVVILKSANTLKSYVNSGSGTFTAGISLSVGRGPYGLKMGDVTGDGNVDIVFSEFSDDSIGYVAGPSFTANDYATPVTDANGPRLFDIADIDDDGQLDFLVPAYNSHEFRWYASGNSTSQQTFTGLTGGFMALAADVDGDRDLDVVLSAAKSGTVGAVYVFHNSGGQLGAPVSVFSDAAAAPQYVLVADIDLSGTLDIVVCNTGPNEVVWLPGTGTGTFESDRCLGTFTSPRPVIAFDFDSDGDLDVAVGDQDTLSVLEVQTVPFPPSNVSVAGGAVAAWAPAADNGASVTSYTVLADGNETATTNLSLFVPTDATTFNVSVRAENSRGLGPWSDVVVVEPGCGNGVRDGNETDVDCGGPALQCGPRCGDALLCSADTDCANADCEPETGRCASCSDGLQNTDETSVDCGGQVCAPCVHCAMADSSVAVAWDAVVNASSYWVALDDAAAVEVSLALEAEFLGLRNFQTYTLTVQGPGAAATCEATPQSPTVALLPAAAAPAAAGAIGDVNDDGDLDLVSGVDFFPSFGASTGSLLLDLNDAVFVDPKPALGDLDADGDLDLVVGTWDGQLRFFLNDGDGWSETSGASPPSNATGLSPALSALTGNLYVATSNGSLYLGQELIATGLGENATVAVCDLDGDGDDEWLVGAKVYDSLDEAPYDLELSSSSSSSSSSSCVARTALLLGDELFALAAHPEPPLSVSVVAEGLRRARVTWEAPTIDGGAAVTGYSVSPNATTATTTATTALVAVDPGQSYAVAVLASNAAGDSAWSDAVAFTAPSLQVATRRSGVGRVVVNWTLDTTAELQSVLVETTSFASLLPPPSEGASELEISGLDCRQHWFNVTFTDAFNDTISNSSVIDAPYGVCPPVCSAVEGEEWVDPTRLDPVPAATACDGNWTLLLAAGGEWELLSNQSSHTRVVRPGATLELDAPVFSRAAKNGTASSGASSTPVTVSYDPATGEAAVATATGALLFGSAATGLFAADESLGDWLPGNGTWEVAFKTELATTVERQPDDVTNTPVDLDGGVVFRSNTPAATIVIPGADEYDANAEGDQQIVAYSVLDGDWLVESSPAVAEWELDTTAPLSTLSPRPDLFSASLLAEFGFEASESGVTFRYCLDDRECVDKLSEPRDDSTPPSTTVSTSVDVDDGPVPVGQVVVVNASTDIGTSFEQSVDGGVWTTVEATVALELDAGWHSIMTRALDSSSGNVDASPATLAIEVGDDVVAPDTFLADLDLSAACSVGETCSFEYSLDAGASWSSDKPAFPTTVGTYVVAARATDAAGNVDPTPAVVAVSVELPDTTVVDGPPAVVAVGTAVNVTAVASRENCSFEYSLDGGSSWAGSWSVDEDAGGLFSLLVRAVDPFGAVDSTPAAVAWQQIAVPPASFGIMPPAVSQFSMAVFAVALDRECVVTHVLDDGEEGEEEAAAEAGGQAIVLGPLSFGDHRLVVQPECDGVPAAALEFGWEVTAEATGTTASFSVTEDTHSMRVYATDAAGNQGPWSTYNWTVDVTAPDTSATVLSVGSVVSVNASCNAEEAHACAFNVSLDDVTNVGTELYGVAEGAHTVTVAAVDVAGNTDPSPVSLNVTVDTTPPEVTVTAVRGLVTNAPLFRVACADCASLSASHAVINAAGLIEPTVGKDGEYNVTVTAVDGAGNAALVNVSFTLDTTAPELFVATRRDGVITNDANWTLNATCSDLHACWVNVSASPPLPAEGAHLVTAAAVDVAGNAGAAVSLNVTIDSQAPVLSGAEVAYHAGGAGATVVVAGCEDLTGCAVSLATAAPLAVAGMDVQGADGSHAVRVTAVDAAGNVADPLDLEVRLDSTAPVVTIASPARYSRSLAFNVTFAVNESNPAGCACWPGECGELWTPPQEGEVAYAVNCSDVRGNWGSANASWVVDWTPPTTALAWNATATNSRLWSFAFAVNDSSPSTSTCSILLLGREEACESPWEVTMTGDEGTYVMNVTTTDAAGNVGAPAEVAFSFDETEPSLVVYGGPSSTTTSEEVAISFGCVKPADDADACGAQVADDDCALSYRVDYAGGWVASASGELELLVSGETSHTVELVAVDAAGNTASETVSWTLVADDIPLYFTSAPAEVSGNHTAYFAWAVDTAEALTFTYRLDGAESWSSAGTQPWLVLTVEDTGLHLLSVAVEGSESSAVSASWTIDHCEVEKEQERLGENGALICDRCPPGVACLNGVASGEVGWWWPLSPSDGNVITEESTLYPCRVPDACPGFHECAEGYEGVMCDTCSAGFGRTLDLRCQPCDGKDNIAVAITVGVVFAISLAVVAVFVVKKSLDTSETARAVSTLKIMANYFLMMGILKDMDLDWGGMLTTLFAYMGVASGSDASDVQLVNCLAAVDTFTQFRIYFGIPVVVVVMPAVAIWGYALAVRGPVRIWGHSKAFVYRQSLLVLSYFAYPVVVTNAFRVLYCTDIEGVDGTSRLVEDFSKRCSGPEYAALFWTALFFVTVLLLGVPLGIFLVMRRRQGELSTKGSKGRAQFFFFVGEFRPEWYGWEITVMLRKVGMGAIAVLLSNHEQKMQVYVGTWLLLLSFTAQIACLPHADAVQRMLETAAQGTVLASLLLGQGMAFEGVTDTQRSTFEGCALVVNLVVMGVLFAVLARETLAEAKKQVRSRGLTLSGAAPPALEMVRSQWMENPMSAKASHH